MISHIEPLTISPRLSIRLTGQRAGFIGDIGGCATTWADLSGLALDCTGVASPLDARVQTPFIAQLTRLANPSRHNCGRDKASCGCRPRLSSGFTRLATPHGEDDQGSQRHADDAAERLLDRIDQAGVARWDNQLQDFGPNGDGADDGRGDERSFRIAQRQGGAHRDERAETLQSGMTCLRAKPNRPEGPKADKAKQKPKDAQRERASHPARN